PPLSRVSRKLVLSGPRSCVQRPDAHHIWLDLIQSAVCHVASLKQRICLSMNSVTRRSREVALQGTLCRGPERQFEGVACRPRRSKFVDQASYSAVLW